MYNDMVNKIWVEMSTKYIHLLQFKIKSLWTLNFGTSELIPKRIRLRFLALHSKFKVRAFTSDFKF